MKKYLFFFSFIVFTTNSFSQSVSLLDSSYHWVWSIQQEYLDKTIYEYDNNYNQVYSLHQSLDSSGWVNGIQHLLTYDANNNLTFDEFQGWGNNTWQPYRKYSYTYDANNFRTSFLWQGYYNSTWTNDKLHTYSWVNNLMYDLFQTGYDTVWHNDHLYTSAYDFNNNVTSRLEQAWDPDSSEWVNQDLYTYTFNINNSNTSILLQHWNDTAWAGSNTITFTYDNDNNLATESSDAYHLITYSYDANNNRLSALYQLFTNQVWQDFQQVLYTYDANNNRISKLAQSWNVNEWVNNDSTHYYYTVVTGINEIENNSFRLYPNPATNIITIETTQSDKATYSIYDLTGRLIQTDTFTQTKQINVSSFADGVYVIDVRTQDGIVRKKFIKQ